jgi:hypothetical protein
VLVPPTKNVGGDEAPFPHACAALTRFAFVILEAAKSMGLGVECPSISDEPAMQVDAANRASADAASGVFRVQAEVIAADRALGDELLECLGREMTAGVHASLVDAILVDLGRVDTIELVHGPIDRKRIAVVSAGRRESQQEKGEQEHEAH